MTPPKYVRNQRFWAFATGFTGMFFIGQLGIFGTAAALYPHEQTVFSPIATAITAVVSILVAVLLRRLTTGFAQTSAVAATATAVLWFAVAAINGLIAFALIRS